MATNSKIFLVIILLASLFRVWGTFEVQSFREDESIQVPSAISLGTFGTTISNQWAHPPLSGLILYGTTAIFGNNPVGWRISNVIFGVLTIMLLYRTARLLYPEEPDLALIAAALLACDPFHEYLSRTTFMEVPVTFFFLLFLTLMLEQSEKQRATLPLAGIALGLTISTKAYFIFAAPLVVFYSLYKVNERQKVTSAILAEYVATLLILPMAIYLLSHLPWFGRGYTFGEFIQMKRDAVWSIRHYTVAAFDNQFALAAGGKPWEWFLKPIMFGQELFSDGQNGRYLLEINNPPFRLLSIPALMTLAAYAWQKRIVSDMLIPLLFAACYLLFLLVQRPMLSYSALVALPFAYIAIARSATLLPIKQTFKQPLLILCLALIALWGVYTFPLVSGKSVPVSLYKPILSIAKTTGKSP